VRVYISVYVEFVLCTVYSARRGDTDSEVARLCKYSAYCTDLGFFDIRKIILFVVFRCVHKTAGLNIRVLLRFSCSGDLRRRVYSFPCFVVGLEDGRIWSCIYGHYNR